MKFDREHYQHVVEDLPLTDVASLASRVKQKLGNSSECNRNRASKSILFRFLFYRYIIDLEN